MTLTIRNSIRFTFALVVVGLFFAAHSALAATYYVDATGGTDSNDGLTTGTAWQTIAKVNGLTCGSSVGQLGPGDSVLLKRGETWREQLTVPCSGSMGAPIVFGAFGSGDLPKFQGYTEFSGPWTDTGGGIYSHAVPAATGYGLLESGMLLQMASDATCADGKWYRGAGPVIYYKPSSGTPNDYTLHYTLLQTAVLATDKQHITVQDMEIEGYSTLASPGYSAIYFNGGLGKIDGITITRVTVHDVASRAIAVDNANAPVVEGSDIYRAQMGIYFRNNTTDGLIRNNRVYTIKPYYSRLTGDMYAIAFGSSGENTGNIIELNEVWDVGDVTVRTNMDAAIAGWSNSDESAAIWRYNFVHDNQTGCLNTGNHGGGSHVHYNILANCGNSANASGKNGGLYLSNASADPSAMDANNNTIYNTYGVGNQGSIWSYPSDNKLRLKNNLAASSSVPILYVPSQVTSVFVSDHNAYVGTTTGSVLVSYHGSTYDESNLGLYVSATNQDTNSLTADPSFTNASGNFSTTSDFSLRYSSPTIDAGTTTDFFGNPIYGTPDIGAIEYQPPYTIGTNEVQTTGSIRLYADGKYREVTASSSATTADLAVAPEGGWGSADYREYMDIAINTWAPTTKSFTATSSIATTTVFTMGGLTPNAWSNLQVDAATSTFITGDTCTNSVCQADGSGNLTFTYDGGWSTHTFALTPGSDPAATGGGTCLNCGLM